MRTPLTAMPGMHASKPEVVGQIMVHPVRTAQDKAVVDAQQRSMRIVTQSDLIAALYRVRRGD